MFRFNVRRAIQGETRWKVCQNIIPREWPDLWYVEIHAGPIHVSLSRSR